MGTANSPRGWCALLLRTGPDFSCRLSPHVVARETGPCAFHCPFVKPSYTTLPESTICFPLGPRLCMTPIFLKSGSQGTEPRSWWTTGRAQICGSKSLIRGFLSDSWSCPKQLYQFALPWAVYESTVVLHSCQHLVLFVFKHVFWSFRCVWF